jgi:homoserine/homoserine lactone efflux protein
MSLEVWRALCATEMVLCFTPGPAVLFVASVAMARGLRAGLTGALGILAGNLFYFALSGTGIAAVILASGRLFTVLKWAGAAYLAWIGLRMLVARSPAAAAVAPQPVARSFARGFVVQAANPKALVFFVALLPQFIDPNAAVGFQLVILGVSSLVIELFVLSLYAALAARARAVAGQRWSGPLERVGGGFLVAAAARLAMVRSQ